MSALFGNWSYDSQLSISHILQKMYEAVQLIPHENCNFKLAQKTGFGHILTYNTPESLYETLPVLLDKKQLLFTAQGRIDNRRALAHRLDIQLDSECTDSSIILKAYLQWGKKSVHYLRGDWSFAVFDLTKQELFIARDPMGYTSIYYYQDKTGFYFSSVLKSLLALPSYNKKLNEEHFIRKLTLWDDDTLAIHSTYYANIHSLPCNHTLTVKDQHITIAKYWQPENISLRHYKNKQDYTHEMLEHFTNAVKTRLRSHKPVASMLSGGLDSSAVSYIAADLLKQENKRLTTFSHVPLYINEIKDKKNPLRIMDETPFIKEVTQASGNIDSQLLNSSDYSVAQGIKDLILNFSACSHGAANMYWVLDIYRNVAKKEFGTLLSGEAGNSSISFAGLDYLLPYSFNRLKKEPHLFLKKQIAKPFLLRYFNTYMNKRSGIGHNLESYVLNIFAQQTILEKYDIIRNIRNNKKEFLQYYPNVVELKKIFVDLYNTRGENGAARGHYYGFELRDPTADVDLMEYFFSIPNEVFFDDHYNNRMLVKRMMKGKIPDKVLFEKKKGLQSADIAYRVKAQALELTSAFENVKHSPAANHYIDVKKLSETWQQYLVKPYVEPYEVQRLLKALQFALFLQMNFD